MAVDLNQIAVRPVLFFAQDHRSRNMHLILDPVATARFHHPYPDGEELLRFDCDPVGVTPTAITTDLDPIRPQIIVETSGDITLGFSFGGDFAEALGSGGFAAWVRDEDCMQYHRRLEVEKAKPFDLLGLVVQEVETPALNHTLFFSDEHRDRCHAQFGSKRAVVIPTFEMVASLVRFANPAMTFHVRLAVRDTESGRVRYLRDSFRMSVGGR